MTTFVGSLFVTFVVDLADVKPQVVRVCLDLEGQAHIPELIPEDDVVHDLLLRIDLQLIRCKFPRGRYLVSSLLLGEKSWFPHLPG